MIYIWVKIKESKCLFYSSITNKARKNQGKRRKKEEEDIVCSSKALQTKNCHNTVAWGLYAWNTIFHDTARHKTFMLVLNTFYVSYVSIIVSFMWFIWKVQTLYYAKKDLSNSNYNNMCVTLEEERRMRKSPSPSFLLSLPISYIPILT